MTAGETSPPVPAKFSDYLELTKPRLSLLSVITALVGYLASRPPFIWVELLSVIIGTSLAAGGVASLNQWMEAETDARMKRTAERPIPAGRIAPGSAFVLGWLMCVAALGIIFANVNGLAAFFTLLTIANQRIPPTINYQVPDPAIPLDVVANVARDARVRHAISNSFGFGGQNVSLVIAGEPA